MRHKNKSSFAERYTYEYSNEYRIISLHSSLDIALTDLIERFHNHLIAFPNSIENFHKYNMLFETIFVYYWVFS